MDARYIGDDKFRVSGSDGDTIVRELLGPPRRHCERCEVAFGCVHIQAVARWDVKIKEYGLRD